MLNPKLYFASFSLI